MSITLTLPVEILEDIDIVTAQANQISRLRQQLDEANVLNTRISQQLATAMAEIRSLRDQVATLRSAQSVKAEPIVIKAEPMAIKASASTLFRAEPMAIKASASTASLRPKVSRNTVSEPQMTKIQQGQTDDSIEPDTEWKQTLKKKIEDELRPMVQVAKDDYETKLKSPSNDTITRTKASQEYNATMTTIRGMATEQFQTALERERQERRWAAGLELSPEWGEALKKEQQSIMMKLAAERRQSLNRDSRSSASN